MQEDCSESNGCVSINKGVESGANVRQQGQDIKAGQIVLTAGTLIRAQEMGLLASSWALKGRPLPASLK